MGLGGRDDRVCKGGLMGLGWMGERGGLFFVWRVGS